MKLNICFIFVFLFFGCGQNTDPSGKSDDGSATTGAFKTDTQNNAGSVADDNGGAMNDPAHYVNDKSKLNDTVKETPLPYVNDKSQLNDTAMENPRPHSGDKLHPSGNKKVSPQHYINDKSLLSDTAMEAPHH